MTALQILRSILKDGVSLTLCKRADGYHIEVTEMDDAGQMKGWLTCIAAHCSHAGLATQTTTSRSGL